MRYIETDSYRLEIGPLTESGFNQLLCDRFSASKKIILVDENSHEHCLNFLISEFDVLSHAEIIEIPGGEEHKQIAIASSVWEALSEYEVSRHDILINLGGGLVSDLGGFVAACYKRGITFINIPTTLLAMVDASIGGKTGVNLGNLKNQVGVFANPLAVYVDPVFLETLADQELAGGFAEMLKHGLISGRELFDRVLAQMEDMRDFDEQLLQDAIQIKHEIVARDPFEKNERKKLNFGHTIGHAIEGYFINKLSVNHGYCIAIGMIMESYLSMKKGLLPATEYAHISTKLSGYYALPELSNEAIHEMIGLLRNDKKNKDGKIMCCQLSAIGTCLVDIEVSEEEFLEVFLHFKNMQLSPN